jgi:hypothetical protein
MASTAAVFRSPKRSDHLSRSRRLASSLDVVQQYHYDLAQRLSDEAALIPRRTAIVERLHKREQQKKDDGE